MNVCTSCHIGRMQKRNIVYLQWHDNGLLIANRMPAVVCDTCGEHMYDHVAVEHLQRLLWSLPPNTTKTAARSK